VIVRRIRRDEWQQVRRLRLEALQDPDAGIAFLDTYADAAGRTDDYWIARTENAADGDGAAQFVAVDESGDWAGTVTVLVRSPGTTDHLDRDVTQKRADLVGVYVRPGRRGDGTIDRLLAAAAEWATSVGAGSLTLDVHADNLRAQRAYRRAGFEPTGETVSGPIGPEMVMARAGRVAE
jgi:GNAT superfamily N-acetyltransferase